MKAIFLLLVLGVPSWVMADGGQLGMGFDGDAWTSNYVLEPTQGYEFISPLTLSYQFGNDMSLYGQTEYASGNYTGYGSTVELNNLSDTVAGGSIKFKTLSLSSIVNVAFNIPTGNPSWESQEIKGNIPTEFIDSRYRGRGFGISGLYGISLPETKGEYGVAVGYLYSGAFNPSYGLNTSTTSLNLGDAVFLALNHVQPDSKDESEVARLSFYYSFPSIVNGETIFQLGSNFSASYSWLDAKAFSLEIGGQAYLPSDRVDPVTDQYGPESGNSYAPRCYAIASYAFGDLVLLAEGKFIFQNNYSLSDPSYDGGGWLAGGEASYRFHMDGDSSLQVSLAFDDVYAFNLGSGISEVPANVDFNFLSVGTSYQIKL